jgi:hypothetical protein
MNVLLVEPSYRSKFPPLGLMRLSTFHRARGDRVTFVRGCSEWARSRHWNRVYVASLFTWELPRAVQTIEFYQESVSRPADLVVGGVGVTLLPDYIRQRCACTIIEGALDVPGRLGPGTPAVADFVPDYSLLKRVDYEYSPRDAFFVRLTKGCMRSCRFCAVPLLEREFGAMAPFSVQIAEARKHHGEKQHVVVMDNNVLGVDGIENILTEIRAAGFEAGAKRKNRQRTVDFNQGLDARLIAQRPALAKHLATVCVSPIRLAFDFMGVRVAYERAIRALAAEGFIEFTNYMLFNFKDSPRDLFDRIWINGSLNVELGIQVTGFPMRFIPTDDVSRRYVAPSWRWRYLRGLQCILLATRGLVGTRPEFIARAFGETFEEYQEILSMPDRYIIYRKRYEHDGARDWRRMYRRLGVDRREELLRRLEELNRAPRDRSRLLAGLGRPLRPIMEHYYPHGRSAPKTPEEEALA